MQADPPALLKYPRTRHLEGSRLQPGDEDLDQVRLGSLKGRHVVVEEKLDGANCAVSFDGSGHLWLQSRGHYLTGGPRERHFEQLKAWASVHSGSLWAALGDEYIMYAEWLGAKHTEFYDDLPHLLLEFDVQERSSGRFLDTGSRRGLLAGTPVVSVPVLYEGPVESLTQIQGLIRPSLYKTARWRDALVETALRLGQDPDLVAAQTDPSELSEGLYLKVESGGVVTERLKWVRADFINSICDPTGAPASHWLDRPHLPNLLAAGVDLYATQLTEAMTALRPGQLR